MRIEDLFGIVTWGQLSSCPQRDAIYMAESSLNRRTNRSETRIMEINLGDCHARPLTAGPDDFWPLPSPDGVFLAFLSRRSGSSQIWILPLNGGEAYQLSAIQGGIKSCVWSSDGSGLVAVAHIEQGLITRERKAQEPDSEASDLVWERHYSRDVKHITHQYYKLDGRGFFDAGRDQLVYVDLKGSVRMLTSGFHHYAEPVFALDGTALFFLKKNYDPEGVHPGLTYVERMAWPSGGVQTLPIDGLIIAGLAVCTDGQRLAFHASSPQDMGYGLTSLYTWDLTSERLVDLSSHVDRSVGDDSAGDVPITSTARPRFWDGRVLTLLSDSGRVGIAAFGEEGGVEALWVRDRVVSDFVFTKNWAVLAVSDPTHPSGIALEQWDTDNNRMIWAPVPWSDGDGPVEPEEFWTEAADGTSVKAWCLKPTQPATTIPAIVEIHGGPMSMYGYRYMHEFQCLVSNGYAVIYANPRGSQGYGREFCAAIMGQWGDKDYRDVMAVLDQALNRYPHIDPLRLGVAGGSYGGFMVNWIISHTNRFRAAVTMRSVVNRFSAMGSSDMGWLRVPQYSANPWWEDPTPFWQQSPLKYVSAIQTPLLIEHQEQDQRLPVEQAEQLYSALKYLGRPVEMVLYPEESHGMSRNGRPWHRVHRLKTIIGWFDRYLGNGRN